MSKNKKNSKKGIICKDKYGHVNKFQDGDYYPVEAIRDKKIIDKELKYLIKWEQWPEASNTWEPIQNLKNVMHLVLEYEALKNPQQDLTTIKEFFEFDNEPDPINNNLIIDDLSLEGDLKHDQPKKIVKIRQGKNYINNYHDIEVHIKWQVRKKTGILPEDSWIPNKDLKNNEAHCRMLAEFYENHLVFGFSNN